MVTGDNLKTAKSIALKCGIISENDGYIVIEGKDFNKRIRDKYNKVLNHTIVYEFTVSCHI